jgi:hypothetical protein
MSHTDEMPVDFMQKVAGELKDAVKKHIPPSPLAEALNLSPPTDRSLPPMAMGVIQLHLCETFAVWKFKAGMIEAIAAGKFCDDIHDCVEATKFFFHQVREKGKLVAFARSRVGDGTVSLTQYNISTLVSSVDQAIEIIENSEENDEVVASDPVVRLLEMPSHHIIALWLYSASLAENRSRALIVRGPNIFTENRNKLLTSAEFFKLLKQSGVIQAITKVGKTEPRPRNSNLT